MIDLEKERAEFEKAWEYRPWDKYEADKEIAFWAWQAARRAQGVPQGYRLVSVELLERAAESLGSFVSDQGWGQADMDAFDDLSALAAAPQPPEARK